MRSDQASALGNEPAVESGGQTLGFERLVFFSDAVFAIVITLLVLPLTAEIDLPKGGEGLASAVLDRWPTVLTFVVSFLVIGQFWTAHHRTFGLLDREDQALLWLNLVTLLSVAFMPFPAALLGAPSETDDAFPVVFFAASMTLTSCALTATWIYAARAGLVRPSVGADRVRQVTVRAILTSVIFALSVPASLLGLPVAIALWLGVLPLARTFVGRFLSPA
jgi:TMEM175 potassium channel family protein